MTSQELFRSLPPLIEGKVYGQLKVTIDEVLWSQNRPGDVVVLVQWWGECDSISLRPSDISNYPEATQEKSSVVYNIHTNFELFEAYLNQCNKINLLVINNDSKEIVGHILINHLSKLITGIQYKNYFPIITSSGKRIGELRVDFELTMNTLSEETASKKNRKRSRRKQKNSQRSCSANNDEENPKQIKRGCMSCSEKSNNTNRSTAEVNKLNLEFIKLPVTCTVPPNSHRSDTSDSALWEVLDRSKKLRDAMTLAVLEDGSFGDLLLDPSSEVIDQAKVKHNGEIASLYDESLVKKYIEGKSMKEEEEIVALKALHGSLLETADSRDNNNKMLGGIQNERLNSASSGKTDQLPASETLTTLNSQISTDGVTNKLLDTVNCFRLTIDNLTLTKAGLKKVNQSLDTKHKNGEGLLPAATFFIECHFVEDSPRSVTQMWKTTPFRFCSRRQIENVVYFGQSCGQSLRPQSHILSELAAASCVVCWRHMHQRVPTRLGSFSLADVLPPSATLPVLDGNTTVAHLRLSILFGKNKLYDDLPSERQERKSGEATGISEKKECQISKVPLKTADLSNHSNSGAVAQSQETTKCAIEAHCGSCSQVLWPGADPLFCKGCIQLLISPKGFTDESSLRLLENRPSVNKRHHEFLIGIDSVVGFPLFAGVTEELSCYVDYKFPEINSALTVAMQQRETTSKVVPCEPQVTLSSVHRHNLVLPAAIPLSPLLDGCSAGITLCLWLRYHQPTPRDHKVALAVLPMDELCLLELKYDQQKQKSPVTKVLELPLALVSSSVTAPYRKYSHLGVLRVTVTYSNFIVTQATDTSANIVIEAEKSKIKHEPELRPENIKGKVVPIDNLLDQLTGPNSLNFNALKNRFWTGPFEKQNVCTNEMLVNTKNNREYFGKKKLISDDIAILDPVREVPTKEAAATNSSQSVSKNDFNILAGNFIHQLQHDLIKNQKEKLCRQLDIVNGSVSGLINKDNVNLFASLSTNSSKENLPFTLEPPADFSDPLDSPTLSQDKEMALDVLSEKSDSDTITGFLKEEKTVVNKSSNEDFEKEATKINPISPKTFKARVKIDRAVNLKAVKGPSNGKKGKTPPSTCVSFGTGNCCDKNCGMEGSVCSGGVKYHTPIVKRNYNPVWNLSWDVDLSVDYLQQADKRLVFRIFEENLNGVFGFASANISILTSGLPCLSSWLSINDLVGACKGQIKVAVTPLEDVSKYQACSMFDIEEDEFEELQETEQDKDPATVGNNTCFVASPTQVFLSELDEKSCHNVDMEVELLMQDSKSDTKREDEVSADDIINDYKTTLENNFRNEMAGLDNLIKFLRVGSMSNELSFLASTENKENLSTNATCEQSNISESRTLSVSNELSGTSNVCERVVTDPTVDATKGTNSEDIVTKLLQQISMFQPPPVRIADNTCQTVTPETKESFTETNADKPYAAERTVHVKDASTETDGIGEPRLSRPTHVCDKLGSALLQHFLTSKPATVKVTDKSSQTFSFTPESTPATTDSSGVFFSSCMSSGILSDKESSRENILNPVKTWMSSDANRTKGEYTNAIDSNIEDLEHFLNNKLVLSEEDEMKSVVSTERSFCDPDNHLSSDVETSSFESHSQILVSPKETLNGATALTFTGSDKTEFTVKRQGTFVIEKSSSGINEVDAAKGHGENEAI